MSEEPVPEYDYFGYKELYVSTPDVCGGDLLTTMDGITSESIAMMVFMILDFFPVYSNWGFFWANDILVLLTRAKNLLHCKIRNEPLLLNSKYG